MSTDTEELSERRKAKNLRNRVVDSSKRKDRKRWEQEKLCGEGRSPP